MPRYFALVDFNGTRFAGWQRQPKDPSVQAAIENALSILLGQSISVMGCGRTDAGVHAVNYVFHFDHEISIEQDQLAYKLNKILPNDILIRSMKPVEVDQHARFSATQRTYQYLLSTQPSVFQDDQFYTYPYPGPLNVELLNEAAEMLLSYEEFYPFCKSNSDTEHYKCLLTLCQWEEVEPSKWVFTIQSNRFLRGMVRLITGMCLNLARGQMTLHQLLQCMQNQIRLPQPWSAPAHGLYLVDVQYPEDPFKDQKSSALFFPA